MFPKEEAETAIEQSNTFDKKVEKVVEVYWRCAKGTPLQALRELYKEHREEVVVQEAQEQRFVTLPQIAPNKV